MESGSRRNGSVDAGNGGVSAFASGRATSTVADNRGLLPTLWKMIVSGLHDASDVT
jgi:hypothetical protein